MSETQAARRRRRVRRPLLEVVRAECVLRQRAGARGRELLMGQRVDRHRGQKRHGQDDALQRDHGHLAAAAPRDRSCSRARSSSAIALVQDRQARDRLRPAGSPPVSVAHASTSTCASRVAVAPRTAPHGRASVSTSCFRGWPSGRGNGGAQLSGGEQQMLAIGRALVTNPRMLVMDEPSEGLAPAVIEGLDRDLQAPRGGRSRDPADRAEPRCGDCARRAPARHDRRTHRCRDHGVRSSADDPDLQRRYLGVEPLAH